MSRDETAGRDVRDACAAGVDALVQWAAGTPTVPRHVLERAARVVADDLAAIVGARDEPEVRAFHARVLARAGRPESTVFRGGPSARTDRLSAAVANAVAGDWLELDEGYRVTPCHAGLYVVPALLAESEARDLSIDRMLTVLAISYEVVTRIARAFSQIRRCRVFPRVARKAREPMTFGDLDPSAIHRTCVLGGREHGLQDEDPRR